MIGIAGQSGWQAKPPTGARVNLGHPLAQGLIRAWSFSGNSLQKFTDSVVGDTLTCARNNADTRWDTGRLGRAFKIGAGGSQTGSTRNSGITANSVSVLAHVRLDTPNTFFENVGGAGKSIFFRTRSAGIGPVLMAASTGFYFAADGAGLLLGAELATAPTTGRWYTVVGTYQRDASVATYGGTWTVYLDGVRSAQNNYPFAGSFAGTFASEPIFASASTTSSDKAVSLLYVWRRALSTSEVASITARPLSFFLPSRRAFSYAAAAAPATSPFFFRNHVLRRCA